MVGERWDVDLPKSHGRLARFPNFVRDVRIGHRLGLTTEQLYDLPEQEQALQIEEYELSAQTCSHCGNPLEKCSDPDVTWFPQMKVCHATMQKAAARRRWEELHPSDGMVWHDGTHRNWSSKQDKRFMFHRDDGVTIFTTEADFGLGGDFLKLEAGKGQ